MGVGALVPGLPSPGGAYHHRGATWRDMCVRGQAGLALTTCKTCRPVAPDPHRRRPAVGAFPTACVPLEQGEISTTHAESKGTESLYLKEKFQT